MQAQERTQSLKVWGTCLTFVNRWPCVAGAGIYTLHVGHQDTPVGLRIKRRPLEMPTIVRCLSLHQPSRVLDISPSIRQRQRHTLPAESFSMDFTLLQPRFNPAMTRC